MPDRSRIPPKPSDYLTYMQRTDARQLEIDPATGNPRWKTWGWTGAESNQWTAFRKRCDELYVQYANKKLKNTVVKDEMHILIRQTRNYDCGRFNGHRLLLKIKIRGNMADWQTFNIKQGTSLEKKRTRSSGDVGSHRPVITVRENSTGHHILSVRNKDKLKSRAKPDGIIFVEMFRYIGTKPPDGLKGFENAGVVKRGIFRSNVSDRDYDRSKKYFAWYYARYQSKNGKLGLPSNVLCVIIIDS